MTEENNLKVDVIDDAPPEDRGRTPLPEEIVKELEKDDLDEYSDKVKTRISQMKKVWHDERREKESAKREREEALRFAQQTFEENKQLKQRLGAGERVYLDEVTKSASNETAVAKENLKRAYETGDPDKIADAQEALTDAKLKLREYQNFKPALQEPNNSVQHQLQTQSAPQVQPDFKAEAWREKNTWFGADEEMTSLALGLHEKLVRSGVDPRSDEYYERVDKTMRKRFSDYFGEEPQNNTEEPEKPIRRASTVVAPATRSTAPRQVRITASEAAIAKRLGLTPEAYAREKMKLENN